MPFAAALRRSLQDRDSEVAAEFRRGDSLGDVLNRHLRTVEQMVKDDVSTCILLLSPDGKRLSVGAAPTLPESYCRIGDSFEIGLTHGSCAAAAFLGRPVYSVDIETDPIWADFGEVALQHGYRSCWSTPIRDSNGDIIGTFALLHRTVGMPTDEEIEAIELIIGHASDAIMCSRGSRFSRPDQNQSAEPLLKLVSDNEEASDRATRLKALAEKLHSKAASLDLYASRATSETEADSLRTTAELCRELCANIVLQIELLTHRKPAR